jgi:NMD protein affecting ribosome stability and mRNA decay
MLCYSCGKQKNDLISKKSTLLHGINLFMCQTCIDNKYEPRWVIILAARSNDPNYVREYIVKRRYVGNEISGSELIS